MLSLNKKKKKEKEFYSIFVLVLWLKPSMFLITENVELGRGAYLSCESDCHKANHDNSKLTTV